ncbi:MAG: hypothetical protein HY731_05055 [Candidatus Tectomicrobia bacterium]|nr:hypothetical protein [Candidatus Tectomicrobia bacterium]
MPGPRGLEATVFRPESSHFFPAKLYRTVAVIDQNRVSIIRDKGGKHLDMSPGGTIDDTPEDPVEAELCGASTPPRPTRLKLDVKASFRAT